MVLGDVVVVLNDIATAAGVCIVVIYVFVVVGMVMVVSVECHCCRVRGGVGVCC